MKNAWLCVMVLLLAMMAGCGRQDARSAVNEDDALKAVEEWARTAAVPETASSLSIETEGNEFTRSFRVNFSLSADDLEAWIEASPGLQDAQVTEQNGAQHYAIQPGGGAQYAEAVIDFECGTVKIYTYWS